MKRKYNLSVIAASTIMLAALPLSAFAATKVSQKFNWDFMYFPQTTGGVVFSDGSFYQSNDPTTGNWSTATIDAKTVDGFSGTRAVSLKHHVYAIGGSNVTTGQSIDLSASQIWSMKSSNPTTLKKVKELSAPTDTAINQFRDLVKYNDDLFASTSNGHIFRSSNGTHWHDMQVTGLPDNFDLEKLVAGSDTLYGISKVTIYTSSNGKDWSELTGAYQNHTYTGGVSVAEFGGKTYVAAYSLADQTAEVWKVKAGGDFDRIFNVSSTDNTTYSIFDGANALYLSGNDGSVQTLSNNKFTLTDTVTGQVQEVVESNGQDIFVVNDSGNISLWK